MTVRDVGFFLNLDLKKTSLGSAERAHQITEDRARDSDFGRLLSLRDHYVSLAIY